MGSLLRIFWPARTPRACQQAWRPPQGLPRYHGCPRRLCRSLLLHSSWRSVVPFLYATHCLIIPNPAPTPPRTINKEWQEASNERALDQKMNPLTGTTRFPLSFVYFAHRYTRYRVRGLQRQGIRPRQLELRERYYITVNQLHTCLFNTVPTPYPCDGFVPVSLPSAVLLSPTTIRSRRERAVQTTLSLNENIWRV